MLLSLLARKTKSKFMKVTGSIMRVVRVRFAALVGVAFLVVLCFHIFLSAWNRSPTIEEIQRTDEAVELACRHPDLDHANPLIMNHIVDLGQLECKREMDWVEIHNGVISINKDIAKRHGKIQCKVTYLIRTDDFSSSKGKIQQLTSDDIDSLPLESDFFHVKCDSKDGLKWKNIMAGVHRNEVAVKRAKASPSIPEAMNLNVLMFGLDSMSRLHYMRKLPKTYRYLKEVLKASVLEGYNIVGDGTPQALIPMLTGYTELELPETRKRMSNANYVNIYPFAWKNFSANAYVTAYAEDLPSTGIFTYRLKGFDQTPTDHYMRSFYVEVDKVLKEHPKLCLGNTPRHVVMMDWLKQFYDAYYDVPKFAFGFQGELSHDDYNLVGYADNDLVNFLQSLESSGILNTTLLILLSDHGHRFSSIREMQQGKQEERLPFFAVVVPPWLQTKYPKLVRNLRVNENRLVTPFDIHATLMTLLHPDVPNEGDLTSRSISLFSEIPQERTCTMASIEPHWCACLSWAKMSTEDPLASAVGEAVIDFINGLTDFQRQECEVLQLKEIMRIEKLQPNKALLKFRKNADKDGFVALLSTAKAGLCVIPVRHSTDIKRKMKGYNLFVKALSNTMRLRCIRSVFLLGFAFLFLFAFYHALLFALFDTTSNYKIQESDEGTCRHPDLDLMNPQIRKHIRDVGELKCNRETDWVETGRGTAFVNKDIVKLHGRITCKLNYIDRLDDFTTKTGRNSILTSDHKYILLEGDFFFVKCEAEDKKEWKNLMAAIFRNETIVDRALSIKPSEHSMKMNVLMYGLDSMSRMHFMRKLPKTYKYLTEVLKASVLKGYNIIGDGTPQALIPILTGQTELELPETRKRIRGAQFVDVYPFAWNNFTANGYVTAWGEEQPHVGTFTYRLKGFKDQPTDHCMRSFYLTVNQVMKNHPNLCLGNKPRHKLMMDYLRDFFDTYHDILKFGFAFNSELSHDDYNIIGYADSDIESFLKGLHENGILDNTFLIVMSDHGHRFAPIRATQQGKQEERLPFFSVVVPPWMHTKYPEYVRNLKINENRLVSPFDIHATFMTILNPNVPVRGDVKDRSISLFSEIPIERTCSLASIEPHWCACLHWSQMSTTEPKSQQVGQAVIDFMNGLTEFQRSKCEELQLSSVLRLEKLEPNEALLKFKKNADTDGFVGEFTDNTKVTEVLYQVQIIAYPSNGIYEAIVKHDKIGGAFSVKEDELSRVNMYGNQEHCIHDEYPNLRKYCYCKKQLQKE